MARLSGRSAKVRLAQADGLPGNLQRLGQQGRAAKGGVVDETDGGPRRIGHRQAQRLGRVVSLGEAALVMIVAEEGQPGAFGAGHMDAGEPGAAFVERVRQPIRIGGRCLG
jgi:hypothetical protein